MRWTCPDFRRTGTARWSWPSRTFTSERLSVIAGSWRGKRKCGPRSLTWCCFLATSSIAAAGRTSSSWPRSPEFRPRLAFGPSPAIHELYGRRKDGSTILDDTSFQVLHDRWAEACPGLIVAGVDDLTARRRYGLDWDPVRKALEGRPAGATLFLSHTPWKAEEAAGLGASLMLAAHTHGGTDLAVQFPRPFELSPCRRPVRCERDARHRVPRHGNLGTAHAPLETA